MNGGRFESRPRKTNHEESMVSACTDDADLDAVLWVPSCKTVENVNKLAGVEVVDGTLAVDLEGV
jgi:hypothetical protein